MLRGQPSRECRFGVERRGDGAAVVEVLGSNGVTRRISFEGGVPARSDAAEELRFEKFGALFLIRIGDERFEVPEAVLTGG
jgi:superfamily II DNA or RNA helicase